MNVTTLRYSATKLLPNYPYLLKKFLETGELSSKIDQDSQSIRYGSAIDALLTTNDFWDKYVIAKYKEPTVMMYKFIRAYIESEDDLYAYNQSGYKTSFSTVLKNFNTEEVQFYYKALKEGKEVISDKTFSEIQNAAEKIEKSEFKYLFTDCLTQVNLTFRLLGNDCSGTLDVLDIDHENKTIRGWDLKTSLDACNFEDSYYKYGYFMQATWYNLAILYYKHITNKELKEYKLLPFRFLVVDKQLPYPLVYQIDRKYRGFDKIVSTLKLWNWHKENNIYINKEHYVNNKIINI